MADLNDQAQELAELLERVNYEMRRFGRISEETAEALAAGGDKRAKELKAAAAASVQALTSVAGAAMASGRAMLEGQKGATAFNSSLDQLTTAATAAGVALTFLIPGGPVIKAFIAGVSLATTGLLKYTQAANKLADDLYKGYSGLAKSGAAAADGMSGLFEDAKKLGLSMGELGDLTSIIGANSKDMALFGTGVADSRKRLASIGRELETSREQFIAMGLNMQEVTEGLIGYQKQQRVAGNLNNRTAEDLAAGARAYLVEQDKLTKLTGLSVKEQESAQEAIRSQERFAAKLEELRQQGRTKEARELEKTYLVLYSQNKEAAQGFADISTNNVQTEAAQKSLMGTQGESMRVAQRISAGQMAAAEGAQRVARAHGETATRLGTTMGQIGTYNETFGDLAADLRLRGLAEKDIVKVLDQIEKDRLKQIGAAGEVQDPLLAQQSKLINTQIQANESTERFVKAGVIPAQQAMIKLAEVTRDSTDAIAKAFGIKSPGQQTTVDMQDEANFAAATMSEKISSSVARGVETAGRGIAGLVGLVSDSGAAGINKMVDKAQASRVAGETQYLQERGRAPGVAPGTGAPATGSAPPSLPGAPDVGAGGPGAVPNFRDYIKFSGGTGTESHFMRLQPQVANAFAAMARDWNQLTGGGKLRINSAYRSPEEQAQIDPGTNPKAAPGMSLHQHGRALDIQSAQVLELERRGLLAQYGFKTLPGDPPHIYMRDGGVIPATPGGVSVTAAEAGRNEAFVPLPDGKTIPVSLQGMDTERLISTISTLSAKLKLIQGDDLVSIARNTSRSAQQEIDRMAKTVAAATQEAVRRGVDVVAATQIKPLEKLQDLASNMMAKGGITQGPSIAGEAGPEAVVPLPDGKAIPVRIDLRDHEQTGPTFAGYNAYKGFNMGPLSTDLNALKDIAGQLGAFDKATQTITDPQTWMKILRTDMLTNYNMGMITVGSKMGGPEVGIEIGERIKEVMATEKTDLDTALKQVTQEFRDSLMNVMKMVQNTPPEKSDEMIELLRRIASGTSRTADANQRLAAVATN
jgi:hypothetical protein